MTVARIEASSGIVPLLNSGPVSWTFRTGLRPNIQTFDVRPGDAALLKNETSPVTLVYKSPIQGAGFGDTKEIRITNLWVVATSLPGANPNISAVRLADRRRFFSRAVVMRRYNHRRPVGFTRILSNTDDTLDPVSPDIQFADWSLNNGVKWLITEMVQDVWQRVKKKEEEFTGTQLPDIEIAEEVTRMNVMAPSETVTAKGDGEAGLRAVLERIPEAAFWVDAEGAFRLFSRSDGKDIDELAKLGPEHVGTGHLEKIDGSLERPPKIRIHFPREVELRFDFDEVGDRIEDTRTLSNVVASPDFTVSIDGVDVVQGTYTELNAILKGFGSPPGIGGEQLTLKVLQTAFVPFLDLWAGMAQLGARDPDIDWSARIAALQSSYRQLFEIDRKYWDRILTVQAKRVGIVNQATGKTGPAEAFADYAQIATTRSMFRNLQDAALDPEADITLEYAMNVRGFPASGLLDEKTKRAPAVVSVDDPEQGIVSVRFGSDRNRVYEMTLPGLIVDQDEKDLGPTGDLTNPLRPVSFDSIINDNEIPKLSADWKLALILTCVPAAPNNERQLEVVEVEPAQVKNILPASATSGLDNAKGPIWDVFVEPGLPGATAMVRWKDDRAADIDAIFGLGNTDPNLDGLVLNKVEQAQIINAEAPSLNAIAQAIAAGIWAGMTDRLVGTAGFDVSGNVDLAGWIESITHTIAADGRVETIVTTPEQIQKLSLRSTLDPSTRAILDREVQFKKQ